MLKITFGRADPASMDEYPWAAGWSGVKKQAMAVASTWGMALSLEGCVEVGKLWLVPAPAKVMWCIGGSLELLYSQPCPQVYLNMAGSIYMNIGTSASFWGRYSFNIAKIELGAAAGVGYMSRADACSYTAPTYRVGYWYWGRRRQNWVQHCNYSKHCDIYFKGYVMLIVVIFAARVEALYWTKQGTWEISLKLYIWVFKWICPYSTILYNTVVR